MSIIQNGETITKIEQRNAKHASGTKIKASIEVTRNDKHTEIVISKKDAGNQINQMAKQTKAKLSWT